MNFEIRPSAKQLLVGRNGVGKSTVLDVISMIRSTAVLGEPLAEHFGGGTRTRWQDVVNQSFELEVAGNNGTYLYKLIVDERGNPPRLRIKEETLSYNAEPLFRFYEGEIGLFNDLPTPAPRVTFPFDWHLPGLATVEEGRRDNTRLTWFKRWLRRLTHVQLNPWAMGPRSECETREPSRQLSNFADWYRHLKLESGDAVFQALEAIREAIPGFQSLDAKEAGLDVRVLQATFSGPNGKRIEMPFNSLSEGQRALIALYVLLYCAGGHGHTLLIDEPDNFIALAEIQPWLLKLFDRVDETGGQVILVSHHPELLDQMASQGGILLDRPDGGETRVRPFEPAQDSGLKPSEIIARGWENA